MSFRVDLPVFSGPMDLLLHLVKQQEVSIHEVSIANILKGYLQHLEVLKALDLSDIGDFAVMASTLMEIKSRELLPRDDVSVEEELDPRDDLIQKLLEYKRYRDISRRLDRLSQRRSEQIPLALGTPKAMREQEDEENQLEMGTIGVWDLTEAFAKLLEEIGRDTSMVVEVEKKNVAFYSQRVMDALRSRPEVPFRELFVLTEGRYGLIGTLIAVLEMMKQGWVRGHQESNFSDITLAWKGPADLTHDELLRSEYDAPLEPEELADEGSEDEVGLDELIAEDIEPGPTPSDDDPEGSGASESSAQ
ncbi:MAG: ScpA family protein [Myxococcota bacterium]